MSVITHDHRIPADDILIRVFDLQIVDLAGIWCSSHCNTLDFDSALESSQTEAAFQVLCCDPFTSSEHKAVSTDHADVISAFQDNVTAFEGAGMLLHLLYPIRNPGTVQRDLLTACPATTLEIGIIIPSTHTGVSARKQVLPFGLVGLMFMGAFTS